MISKTDTMKPDTCKEPIDSRTVGRGIVGSRLFPILLAFSLFFLVEVALQYAGGAFQSEFGNYPDEAGHFVTGLMVRDYLASLDLANPMAFAENYYIHYPKVALGHWPPFFYMVQAAWTLIFSPSRLSVVMLMASLTALLAGTVFLTVRKEFGSTVALAAGMLLLAVPLVQEFSSMLMTEVLVALLCFWAVLYYGRYLDGEKWPNAVGFGLCASLAIMTKGTALALALVPVLAILMTRRFYLLGRLSFWIPVVVVLLFCAPFYYMTLDMVMNGWQDGGVNLGFTLAAIPYYSLNLIKLTGFGLFILVATGFVVRVIRPVMGDQRTGKWGAIGAWPLSVLLYQSVIPCGLEGRHLIPAVPALLLLLAAGLVFVADRLPLPAWNSQKKVMALSLAALMVFAGETFAIPGKATFGFEAIATDLLAKPEFSESVFLISSDANGEGMFISEIALRESRPGHIVLRASKVLASSTWGGEEYEPLFKSTEEIMTYLDKIPVGIVVTDRSMPENRRVPHHQLLEETVAAYPQNWRLLGTYPVTRKGTAYPQAVSVYRQVGHENEPVKGIEVDMGRMLDKSIEKK